MMRKASIVLLAALLTLGLIATLGCGGSSGDGTEKEVISLNENVADGVVGTFTVAASGTQGGGSITFSKGGTFTGNAWGSERKGKYTVEERPGGGSVVKLTFDGGQAGEEWSVGISMGKVAAVTSPDGVQFNKGAM